MITFKIISVGKPPSDWRREGFEHYVRLIRPYARVEDVTVKEQKIRREADVPSALGAEGKRLLAAAGGGGRIIALHDGGKFYTTKAFADRVAELTMTQSSFSFIIGGAYGLDQSVLDGSDDSLSLSAFTLPHDLAKIVLAEQLYRALSIINNLPYHK